jgi:ribosomal protein S18 acetylase RimI-like enzyme
MIIRDFLPEDYQQIFDLWVELDMGGLERGDTLEVLLQTIDKGGKLLIMEEPVKHSIIGSSWITNDGRRLFLHHFGIKKDYQGRGLGMKLAIASLKFIKEKGMQVKLEVHKENIAAKKLYEKTGFNAFTDYDIYMIRKPHEIDPAEFEE